MNEDDDKPTDLGIFSDKPIEIYGPFGANDLWT
jgi:hypothetical protein